MYIYIYIYMRIQERPPPRYRSPRKIPNSRAPALSYGGEGDVIVCPGGPGLITFPRICTSATIIAINSMTTRFPSLAQVGQPRDIYNWGSAGNPGRFFFSSFFLSFFLFFLLRANTRSLDNRPVAARLATDCIFQDR